MAGQEKVFELAQAGIETTRGTAVAATRKWYVALAPWKYERALTWGTNVTGTRFPRRQPSYARPVTGFTGTEDLSYEDLAWVLQFIIKGGVTGVTDAGSPPVYQYAFQASPSTDDIKSMTLEYGTPTLSYEANQVMVNSATFRFDPDNQANWQADYEMIGRAPSQTAKTSLSDRAGRELIQAPGTLLYIDDAGGTVGTTQITGRFIGGTLTINNNLAFKAFAEDTNDFAANKVGIGDYTVDCQLTFEFDSDTEYAYYRTTGAPVQRLIRIYRQGTQLHSPAPGGNKRAYFDLYGYWSSVESGYRDNNKILTFGFEAGYDVTAGYQLKAFVYNGLATLV
jgi:hypothetical protein